jgi:hypothetical protein
VTAIVACFSLAAIGSAQNRARLAEIELVGPVAGVVLDAGRAGSTHIEGALSAGETRRLTVPIPVESDTLRAEPIVRFDEPALDAGLRGRVRFAGWSKTPSRLERLSAGLRARSMPALSEARVHVSRAAPLVLVAALVIALALRRRARLALASALVLAAALNPLASAPARESDAAVRVIDGNADDEAWRQVDASIGEITVPDGVDDFELVCDPAGAAVTWFVPLERGGGWRARSSGTRLFVESVFAAGEGRLTRARNAMAAFEQTWLRDEGAWTARGTWPLDAALPAPSSLDSSAGSPPGWLAGNLPQGVAVLIALEADAARKPAVWVRVSLP